MPTPVGFDWWPGHFRVSLLIHSDTTDAANEKVRVAIKTDFLKAVPLEDQKCRRFATELGRFAPLFAWMYVPRALADQAGGIYPDRRVWFQSVFYLDKDNVPVATQFITLTALLQAIAAEFQAEHAAQMLHAEPDRSCCPNCDQTTLHPGLFLLESEVKPAGALQCPLTSSEEFAAIAPTYGQNDSCFGIAGSGALTLETPVGDSSALIQLRTDVPHPALGNGLLASLELPFCDTDERINELCCQANFFQATTWSNAPLFSSWYARDRGKQSWRPATGAFVPNAFCTPGLPTYLALSTLSHARFIKSTFWPELTDLTMAEILERRMASAAEE